MDHRGAVGRIYKEDHYTQYAHNRKALGLVISEKIFICFFSNCKSMVANNPRGGAIFDTRDMVGRNYKEDNYTLLHTKYESSGPCDLEKIFLCFSHDAPGMDPRDMVARIYKEEHYTLLHTKYEGSGPCGFGDEDFVFDVFPIVSLWELMTPGAEPIFTPGAWLAGFIKRATIHCYIQHMKALGRVISEKIFVCFSHCKSMGANDARGWSIFDPRGMVGRNYKEDH